ncbi:MAG: retropepsin-like aspartic protease [Pirellulales bacterium]
MPIRADLYGPVGTTRLRLALDTGATRTAINVGRLVSVGYDPALSADRVQVTTGSGVEYAPRVVVERLEALDQERLSFPLLAHTLPPSTGVDGLLGLDFLRGLALTIDFRSGRITLT